MGFLDMFDDPNVMSTLLGIGGNSPQPQAPQDAFGSVPPQPPQPQQPPVGPIGNPMGDAGGMGGQPGPMQIAPPQLAASVPGNPMGDQGGAGGAPAPMQEYPTPTGVPLPTPRPNVAGPAPGPGGIGSDANAPTTQTYGAGGLRYPVIGAGANPNASPEAALAQFRGQAGPPGGAPGAVPGQPPAPQNTYGLATPGNSGAPTPADKPKFTDPNNIRAMLSGMGKGLSAVGSLPFGASKGQAAAAGAGGALQGTVASQEQLKKNQFDQTSAAFKDMMLAKNNDDTAGYRQAQTQYLKARAQSIMTGGGANGSKAWQSTDYGKTIGVENEVQKYEKGQQIILQKQWATNGTDPDTQKSDIDRLNKQVDGYRQRLYKQIGIDPDKAQKIATQGQSKDNPFDTKGMTPDQFHQMVPMGAWYKSGDKVLQRTVPPPGYGNSSQNGSQGSPTANYYDDQTAMTPAA
jgi:hypothetical protein